jgi:hypothetical protein
MEGGDSFSISKLVNYIELLIWNTLSTNLKHPEKKWRMEFSLYPYLPPDVNEFNLDIM